MDIAKAFEGVDMDDAQSVWEVAQNVLHYDEATGWFYEKDSQPRRRVSMFGRGHSGGTKVKLTPRFTTTGARLVWLWHNGEWPRYPLKRKNGIATDERIWNLTEDLESLNTKRVGRGPWKAHGADGRYIGRHHTQREARAAIEAYDAGLDLF